MRMRPGSIPLCMAALIGLGAAAPAHADDAPSFDRPGIAFSTGTLPKGRFAWEQGLPDFQRDDDGGARSTQYNANTTLRLGLSDTVELQLATSPYNYLRERNDDGGRRSRHGAGDTGLALKVALPSSHDKFSWAVLGAVTAASGARDFSNGATQYTLGTTLGYDFSERVSGALYFNLDRSDGEDTWTWSPSLSVALSDTVGAYIEAGMSHIDHQSTTSVAGAGVTWMATSRVQLDASLDWGLDRDSPDLQGGIGVAVLFD
ncbi:transporter [Lysobacter capsici]|uniref:transporter n=1 Tax=Lysobacter capsici TaxID=435897 RepID=UPI001E4AF180|nr:transporter [Lysobacter capsici]